MVNKMKIFKLQLPLLSALITVLFELLVPDSSLHKSADHEYLVWLIVILTTIYEIVLLVGSRNVRGVLLYKSAFYTAFFQVFLGQCLLYTLRIQLSGWLLGVAAGICTGIAIGFSKRFRYWCQPLVRVLGPIPPTAWIPIVLVVFPSVIVASSFLIALAVWFPTTVLTSNGIANIKNSYFEVASTLGAGKTYSVFKVGIPAAMPFMFIGIFNGTCSSFITLVTAEMLGAKYGIGWYINWQKEMMSYANVYAGLIVMSLVCFVVISVLFKLRDRLLVWQKGVIKW